MKSKTILHSIAQAIFHFKLALTVTVLPALMLLGSNLAKAQTVYVGNSLVVTNGASDNGAPIVILGEYNPAGPSSTAAPVSTLVAGTVQNVQFYGQNYNFTLYALSYVGTGPYPKEQKFKVLAAENFAGTNSSAGIQTIIVNNFTLLNAGDLLAFAGKGPYYPQNANNAPNTDATYQSPPLNNSIATPPGSGATFTVGTNGDQNATYNYITNSTLNQGRTYGFGVNVSESFIYPIWDIPERFGVIDITPTSQSSESLQNAEPSIAVGTGTDAGNFAVHVFGNTSANPIYTTSGSDLVWTQTSSNPDVDATMDWSSGGSVPGGTAYLTYLESTPNFDFLNADEAGNSTPSAFSTITSIVPTGLSLDQPWTKVATVNGADHIYIGYNNLANSPNPGKTASVHFSLNGGTTWSDTVIDKVALTIPPAPGWDSPASRIAISASGTNVYAVFQRARQFSGVDFASDYTGQVVVVRDDNMGLNKFGALPSPTFPNNLTTGQGTIVATVKLPWASSLGVQRLGSGCDIAVVPTAPKQVYVAYTELLSGTPVIQVESSTDGGNTFTLQYSAPYPSSLPSLSVDSAGTLGMLYLAQVGLNLEVHFTKFFNGSFTPANTVDRVLARFPNNNPIRTYDPYVGDYFQVKYNGNNFYGAFCASGNPLTADFPSGVYYQRDVKVGGTVKNNFTLTANGTLWTATTGGTSVAASIDPFFFYDIAPEWWRYGPVISFKPPFFYDPGDPFSGDPHILWPVLPTNYPPVQLQTSSSIGAGANWVNATNPIIQANGQYETLLNTTQQHQQFYRLVQNVSAGQFNLTAVSDGNGSINPNGVIPISGGQSLTFTATPSNNYAISSWYLDGTVVQSDAPSLTLSNINAGHTVFVTFAPANDIGVTVSGLPQQPPATVYDPAVTNDLIYNIQVVNTGQGTVTGVTMSNTLPLTVTLVSATTSQGSLSTSSNLVTANLGTLAPGASAVINIDVQTPVEGFTTDSVSVACNQFEPNLANNVATDIVQVVAPANVTTQPVSQTVSSGSNVTFSVGVSGTPPLIYQWYFDDTNAIIGATASTLTVSNVTAAASGTYSVSVSQQFGPEDQLQTFSDDAVLTVQ